MNFRERMEFEAIRNIHRDKKGRLNKGAELAKKVTINKEYLIRDLYDNKVPVRTITLVTGISKSTVYNVIKKYKKVKKDSYFGNKNQ